MRIVRPILVRLLLGLLSLLFISFVTFIANERAGDPAVVLAGEKATPDAIARIRENMGLNRPWPIRYVDYLWNAGHGDFGISFYGTHEPVSEIIKRNLPMTLRLAGLAILLASFIGILLGTIAGVWQNRAPDRVVLVGSTLGVTLPNFVVTPLLLYVFCL